jgi:hypothetical protein
MRAAKAIKFLTGGYELTSEDVIGAGVFREGTENNMVLVKDIDIHSLCEHHLLPFSGKVCGMYSCLVLLKHIVCCAPYGCASKLMALRVSNLSFCRSTLRT